MKIAIIGYGKMGKTIEEVAIERGHEIVMKINSTNKNEFTAENLKAADIAIEFTSPESAYDNVITLIHEKLPVVCGSTGWLDKLDEVKVACANTNGAFLYASNFSIGVNIFFELNKKLASLMAHNPGYKASIEEVHHTAKKDAPSGTAIKIARDIISGSDNYKSWVNTSNAEKGQLPIESKRIDPAPGTHTVKYASDIDDIIISHVAHNRKGFAMGAVLAAEFLLGKQGIYSMKDILTL